MLSIVEFFDGETTTEEMIVMGEGELPLGETFTEALTELFGLFGGQQTLEGSTATLTELIVELHELCD